MSDLSCPWCGWRFPAGRKAETGLVPVHMLLPEESGRLAAVEECPGSNQNPRNPESDLRPLWKDQVNGEDS